MGWTGVMPFPPKPLSFLRERERLLFSLAVVGLEEKRREGNQKCLRFPVGMGWQKGVCQSFLPPSALPEKTTTQKPPNSNSTYNGSEEKEGRGRTEMPKFRATLNHSTAQALFYLFVET